MNFLRQGFRKLSSDRQTDRETDTTEIIYHATLRVVKKEMQVAHASLETLAHINRKFGFVIIRSYVT